MSACKCLGTFKSINDLDKEESKKRAEIIDASHPNCGCESKAVSEHSPGPVNNDEYLIRLVIAPQHNKNNRPKPAVLGHAETSGMSVFRSSAGNDEIRKVAATLIGNARKGGVKGAGLIGVLEFQCSLVRDKIIEGDKRYCVYDTAEDDKPNHAEVFQRVLDLEIPERTKVRNLLFGAMDSLFVPAADFRDGAFFDLTPENFVEV